MELSAFPAVGFMIVALSALNLHAEKNARDFRRNIDRAAFLSHDQAGRAIFANIAGGCDKRAGDLIPRRILVELRAEVLVERRPGKLRAFVAATVHNYVAPIAAPVFTEPR